MHTLLFVCQPCWLGCVCCEVNEGLPFGMAGRSDDLQRSFLSGCSLQGPRGRGAWMMRPEQAVPEVPA